MKKKFIALISAAAFLLLCSCGGSVGDNISEEADAESSALPNITSETLDLSYTQDESRVLQNPDKGWYLHYYDNGIKNYCSGLMPEDITDKLPMLDHIYLRLAWSYLEPREGEYNWEIIDKVIKPWTEAGIKTAFRITCKETSSDQPYATPKWVFDAGAKYTEINGVYEPDYGDPIFLEKLENFHKAFAARYANRPETVYVDIGSYGDWGEGHTIFGSKKDWPWETIKKHIDIYLKYYTDTRIVISDDFIDSRGTQEGRDDILNYVLENDITFRDDSVSVKWFADNYGYSTLRSTHLFDLTWKRLPSILELEHYHKTLQEGTWQNGGPFLAAAKEAHATYAGFHGDPLKWVRENPQLAKTMGNQLGYWYFLDSVSIGSDTGSGEFQLSCKWRNNGFSVAYNKYNLQFKFSADDGTEIINEVDSFDNTKWQPASSVSDVYHFGSDTVAAGKKYRLSVRMYDDTDRTIELGFNEQYRDSDGFYSLGYIQL